MASDEVAPLDDAGHDEVAVGRVVDGVDPDAALLALAVDRLVGRAVVGGDEGELVALDVAGLVLTLDVAEAGRRP